MPMRIYTLRDAADYLLLSKESLKQYAMSGRIKAQKGSGGAFYFAKDVLDKYREESAQWLKFGPRVREIIFDARHERGAYKKFLEDLRERSEPHRAIGERYELKRETIRQLQAELYPENSRGYLERRRESALKTSMRELFQDPVFKKFYRLITRHVSPRRIELIQSGRTHFRRRAVKIDGRIVLICKATRRILLDSPGPHVYAIHRPLAFFHDMFDILGDTDHYLFMPRRAVPPLTMYTDSESLKYYQYRDNFRALRRRRRNAA